LGGRLLLRNRGIAIADSTNEQLQKQLELLDQRLDNLDSVVTALVERVMKQPVTIHVVCPKCGETIQINVTSSARLGPKPDEV